MEALAERMKDQDFANTLGSQPEPLGTEDDEVIGDGDGDVLHDGIDSSRTLDEEITDLMTSGTSDGPSDEDEVCVGTNLEQYIGYEFSSQTATSGWMQWNKK